MKTLFLLWVQLAFIAGLFAQSEFVKLKVFTQSKGIQVFVENGIEPIHGFLKKDGTFIGDFKSDNIQKLKNAGIAYEVLIDDLVAHYKHSNQQPKVEPVNACFHRLKQYPVPHGFQMGSMGSFYTFDEAMAEIDTMISLYPSIISAKTQIGTSFQGRPIYSVKISDNPSVNENEPQALYTAIHHSQEPASLQQLIYYMYFLLENYGTNNEVNYLIDNTELYFVPVINPDGYVYNQDENPTGGGLHRKNRRTSLFSDGVDLNRNYDWYFGYNETGSSSVGFHPWHRGDSAFSEPEAQAMKNFMEAHQIKVDVHWHSYGNMIIYPWNYENHYTQDSLLYEKLGETMSYQNNYRYGTVYETYGYQSNGDADDWGYGEMGTKNKNISITAEIGNMDDGFWPDPQRIYEICNETVWTNLSIAHFAHAYYEFKDISSSLIDASTQYLPFQFQSVGLDTPATFSITFNPISGNITFPNPSHTFTDMGLMQLELDSIQIQLNANLGDEVKYTVSVNNGLFTFVDTITKQFGNIVELFYDNCETINNWTGDDWDASNESSFSGSYAITESPNEDYWLLQTSEIVLNQTIDLTGYSQAVLQFYTRYNLENNYDYVQIFASTDNGSNWTPLCGRLTKVGTDDEDEGQPVYHGMLPEWTFEEISLEDYLDQTIQLKFLFEADQSGSREGFYFDDFSIKVIDNSVSVPQVSRTKDFCNVNPNPANDFINFTSNVKNRNLEIYNALGIKVYSSLIKEKTHIVNVSEWQEGFYFYKLEKVTHCEGKFIIKK